MKKGYLRLPQFPESSVTEKNESKFRLTVRTPTSEDAPLTPDFTNFEEMTNSAELPLIPGGNSFDEEDYLSEGNRQHYGLQGNDKSRRKKRGFWSRCWWFCCGGWRDGCLRHVFCTLSYKARRHPYSTCHAKYDVSCF